MRGHWRIPSAALVNMWGWFLPLGCWVDQSDEKNTPLRGRDCLRGDPKWSPGFLNYFSWMFPEQLRNKSELVGSEETHQALTRHPRYVTLFCLIPSRNSSLLSLRSPQRPGRCNLELIQGQVRSVLYCLYCLQEFLSELLLISSCFLTLPYCWGKTLVSGEDWI